MKIRMIFSAFFLPSFPPFLPHSLPPFLPSLFFFFLFSI